MSDYLNPGDHRSFDGHTVVQNSSPLQYKHCPKCAGHGRWNLRVDAYGPGRHFVGVCDHCSGWGLVDVNQTCVNHNWKHTANLGRCYNEYTCTHCGAVSRVDSGD